MIFCILKAFKNYISSYNQFYISYFSLFSILILLSLFSVFLCGKIRDFKKISYLNIIILLLLLLFYLPFFFRIDISFFQRMTNGIVPSLNDIIRFTPLSSTRLVSICELITKFSSFFSPLSPFFKYSTMYCH